MPSLPKYDKLPMRQRSSWSSELSSRIKLERGQSLLARLNRANLPRVIRNAKYSETVGYLHLSILHIDIDPFNFLKMYDRRFENSTLYMTFPVVPEIPLAFNLIVSLWNRSFS